MLVFHGYVSKLAPGAALALLLALGCETRERAPPYVGGTAGEGGTESMPPLDPDPDPACEGPPTPDTKGLCGEQVVPVVVNRPTLYFVLDVSGSMIETLKNGDSIPGSDRNADGWVTKLEASQAALVSLTLDLGHRIQYGLATFPGPDADGATLLGCGAGQEAFASRDGDPLRCVNRPGGKVHDAFTDVVGDLVAGGGTPLSATLEALTDTILALPRPAYVVLLTDGAPNCNVEADCGVDACIPNLEGGALPSGECDDSFNCCDSDQVTESDLVYIGVPEAMCVDGDASLAAVEKFADAGIRTFVIGAPGSDNYGDLMNALADAGGGNDGSEYFDVRDARELSDSLAAIGAETSQGCTVELQRETSRPDLLNVYFDAELVAQGSVDGWTLSGAEVTFHGDACAAVSSGQVTQIQLISGCPTVY
jgi:hypothetical protein